MAAHADFRSKRASAIRARDMSDTPRPSNVALLRSFVEYASVPSFLVTAGGTLTFANRACEQLLGFSREELIGVDFRTLVHPGDLDAANDQIAELLAGKVSTFQSERRYLRNTGEPVWVLTSVAHFHDQSGLSFLSVQAVNIEIQKQAEARLAESERRWAFALDSAGQGVWEADIVNNTVHYSPTWKRIRGYEPDEDVDSSAGNLGTGSARTRQFFL